MTRINHWIDGHPVDGAASRTAEVFDPATGRVTGEVALGTDAEVDAAVAAAAGAFPAWRDSSMSRRTSTLFAFRELVNRHLDELAALVTAQHGKVLSDARGEVQRGLEVIEFACGIPTLLTGQFSDQVSTGIDAWSFRQPLGVMVGITPFNFPAMVPMWMYPVAIACGNTFVLKPSERDPSVSVRIAQLWREAGLPDGVFNVVQGDREAVDRLLRHPDVAAVSFVGSTPIARSIHEVATAHGKRVQALGGAKNHAIVLPDASLDHASDHLASAAFGSAGERCMAISAAVAVGSAGDRLVDWLDRRASSVRVGAGTDPSSQMGPVITAAARDRIVGLIGRGAAQGGEVTTDGRGLQVPSHPDGFFVGPTVIDRVTTDMDVYTEEVFGPVLGVLRAETLDEAIALVNANPYGNGTAVFTRDGGAARRFVREVQVGMVGINVPVPVPMAWHSFGGWKDSLIGDSKVHGAEGIAFCTRAKAVTARWPEPDLDDATSLDMPTAT